MENTVKRIISVVRIVKNSYGEYVCKAYDQFNVRFQDADCFESDLESAQGTMRAMLSFNYGEVDVPADTTPAVESTSVVEPVKSDSSRIVGSARIGHGTKLHRAYKDSRYGIGFYCSCPGTNNGSACHKATFFPGVESNCGN